MRRSDLMPGSFLGIWLVTFIAGSALIQHNLTNSGVLYDGANGLIRLGILLLIVAAVCLALGGALLAHSISPKLAMIEMVIRVCTAMAGISLIALVLTCVMLPRLNRDEIYEIYDSGSRVPAYHSIFLETASTSLTGLVLLLVGLAGLALRGANAANIRTMQHRIVDWVLLAGAIWGIVLGLMMASGMVSPGWIALTPAVLGGIAFVIASESPGAPPKEPEIWKPAES